MLQSVRTTILQYKPTKYITVIKVAVIVHCSVISSCISFLIFRFVGGSCNSRNLLYDFPYFLTISRNQFQFVSRKKVILKEVLLYFILFLSMIISWAEIEIIIYSAVYYFLIFMFVFNTVIIWSKATFEN